MGKLLGIRSLLRRNSWKRHTHAPLQFSKWKKEKKRRNLPIRMSRDKEIAADWREIQKLSICSWTSNKVWAEPFILSTVNENYSVWEASEYGVYCCRDQDNVTRNRVSMAWFINYYYYFHYFMVLSPPIAPFRQECSSLPSDYCQWPGGCRRRSVSVALLQQLLPFLCSPPDLPIVGAGSCHPPKSRTSA